MKKYKITGKSEVGFTVTLNERGIVDVDGLPSSGAETLKLSVERYIDKHNLPPLKALGKAIGPYATAVELDAETSVSDLL